MKPYNRKRALIMTNTMKTKLDRYLEIKKQLKEYNKRPIGDRIKTGGCLENRIKQAFSSNRSEQILTRSKDFIPDMWEQWDKLRTEESELREELEEAEIILYTGEGDEFINKN